MRSQKINIFKSLSINVNVARIFYLRIIWEKIFIKLKKIIHETRNLKLENSNNKQSKDWITFFIKNQKLRNSFKIKISKILKKVFKAQQQNEQ
jgi:hypothetical protein